MSGDDNGDNGTGEEDDGTINITLGKIVAYPVGGLLLLIGLAGLADSVVGGALILLAGVLALPIIRSKIKQSQGVAINRWATVGIVAVLLVAGGAMMGGEPPGETAEAEQITHQMGESFTVGDDDEAIEYTVHEAYSTSVIYGFEPEETDEQFIVLEIEMTNVGDESIRVAQRHFQTVDSQDRQFDVHSSATRAADRDDRFQHDSVTFEQLDPGVTQHGMMAFEMPAEETDNRFKIEPVGVWSTADEHYVELEIEQLEE